MKFRTVRRLCLCVKHISTGWHRTYFNNHKGYTFHKYVGFTDSDIREFTQRQEYDYDYVNDRIKLQTQHYFTGIPFKSYRNPFYITAKQQITVIAI